MQKEQALRRKRIREIIELSKQSQSTSMDTKMPTVGSKRNHHHHGPEKVTTIVCVFLRKAPTKTSYEGFGLGRPASCTPPVQCQ